MAYHPVVLAMTAHAERMGVLALLGTLMLVGWCAVALALAADSGESGARAVGAVVSKRQSCTTIVIGGPFAAAAIVVSNSPDPTDAVPVDDTSDAGPRVVADDQRVIFGSVAISSSWAVPDATDADVVVPGSVPDYVPAADVPAARDAAMLLDKVSEPEPVGFDGAAVIVEADRILVESAALEVLWRMPAATAEQPRRRPSPTNATRSSIKCGSTTCSSTSGTSPTTATPGSCGVRSPDGGCSWCAARSRAS